MNYVANEASNSEDMTTENGFKSVPTPMFVNCPDIGPVGDLNADMKTDGYQTEIDLGEPSTLIQGSDMSLILQGGVDVTFMAENGDVIATTQTNMMGAYEVELESSSIPEGTTAVMVMANGNEIRSIPVTGTAGASPPVPTDEADGDDTTTTNGNMTSTNGDSTDTMTSDAVAFKTSIVSVGVSMLLAASSLLL